MEGANTAVSRVQKHIDALNTKNAKQADEILRLKKQLTDQKASQSRIKRIPKATATTTTEAPPAEVEATA